MSKKFVKVVRCKIADLVDASEDIDAIHKYVTCTKGGSWIISLYQNDSARVRALLRFAHGPKERIVAIAIDPLLIIHYDWKRYTWGYHKLANGDWQGTYYRDKAYKNPIGVENLPPELQQIIRSYESERLILMLGTGE